MVSWKDWNPGLDNDALTMQQVLDTLPGNDPAQISHIVRLFENPASPFALKGAVNLERHDCIHIVLGRGLLGQDEAFVIGYTMGTSKNVTALDASMFKLIAEHLYPKVYQFRERHQRVYDLAVELGANSKVQEIYEFPFEHYTDKTLGEIRALLGLNVPRLRSVYQTEQKLFPKTPASKRLPV